MSKQDFTIFKDQDLVYLDHAASSLTPDSVLLSMDEYYYQYRSNVHRGVYQWSEKASEAYDTARKTIASFINAKPSEMVFTQGATQGINIVAYTYLKPILKKGDVILLSPLEHHANMIPWQRIAKECGARIEYIPLCENFSIDWEKLEKRLDHVVFMAVTHMSNVLGVQFDIQRLAAYGIDLLVDGAQMISHTKVDVSVLGCGFYVFSGHKMYGPTGIGGLYVNEQYHDKIEPLFTGGGMVQTVSYASATFQKMPVLLEPGTPNIAGAIGCASAAHYLSERYDHIQKQDKQLSPLLDKMLRDSGMITYGVKGPIGAFQYPKVHSHDVATLLAEEGVMVRAGHHCCMPLMLTLGVDALVRASLGIHNDESDIMRFEQALKKVSEVML